MPWVVSWGRTWPSRSGSRWWWRTGLDAMGLPTEDSERPVEREERKWTEVVRANNVKPD